MREYFADTSFYVSLLHPGDVTHQLAQRVSEKLEGAIVTTDFIFLELSAYFARPPERAAFCRQWTQICNERNVTVLQADRGLVDRGWEIYSQHLDKGWSLTDCISFSVMRERGIREGLTTDHHFEQAGFVVLLRELTR